MSSSMQEVDNFIANVDKILISTKQSAFFLFSFYEILWKKSGAAPRDSSSTASTPYYI